MTAEIIKLREGLTPAQYRQAFNHFSAELQRRAPRDGSKSLCQDIALLLNQIRYVAFLAGAKTPLENGPDGLRLGSLDDVFQNLFNSADAIFGKSMDWYPDTQGFGKKPRKRRASTRAK